MALLVALFIAVPIVELYVIIQIGGLIGVVPTLSLLLADAVLGSVLLRHEGRGAWRRFNLALNERRFPGKEVADGVMIAVGGTLLLTPGFVTDIFGLLLLLPPSRAAMRRLLRAYFAKRFLLVNVGARAAGARYSADRPYDFDAHAEEIDPNAVRLPAETQPTPPDPPADGGKSD